MRKKPKLTKAAVKVWQAHRAIFEQTRKHPTYQQVADAAGIPSRQSVKNGYLRLKQLGLAWRVVGASSVWRVKPYRP